MASAPAAVAEIRSTRRDAVSAGETSRQRFRRDVLAGLALPLRAIPSVWFYDAWGSRLFERIMRLPGYYPTRIETGIIERHANAMVALLASGPSSVVDLGAGDGTKTRLIMDAALRRSPAAVYVPVDVSATALEAASEHLRASWPALEVRPVHGDYVDGLARASHTSGTAPLLALLLGSNIGNLEWTAALALLRSLRRALRPGDHLMVGFDLLKPEGLLRGAYDDPEGVTAAFNLNLLSRVNRELGADFDLSDFEHRATFDAGRPAMESWLVSRRRQVVHVAGQRFEFREGEAIQTEISWKYTEAQIAALAQEAGFEEVERFHDERRWFSDALWRVGPEAA